MGNRSGKEHKYSFGHTEVLVVKILEIPAQIKFKSDSPLWFFEVTTVCQISTKSTIVISEHRDHSGRVSLKVVKWR